MTQQFCEHRLTPIQGYFQEDAVVQSLMFMSWLLTYIKDKHKETASTEGSPLMFLTLLNYQKLGDMPTYETCLQIKCACFVHYTQVSEVPKKVRIA